MRPLRLLSIALLSIMFALPAAAQNQWRSFQSDSDGFAIDMPETPTISARRIGDSDGTQTTFLIDRDQVAYLVSVIMPGKGKVPASPDRAYYEFLLKNYAEGSKTQTRTSRLTTVAGKPGFEAITDAGGSAHVLSLVTSGDRIYMTVYVGPKGQEDGSDPVRFRGSFRLVSR